MSDATLAIVSAVIGGVVGAIVAWLLMRLQTRSDRAWEVAFHVSSVQAEVLSPSTPRLIKSRSDVDDLDRRWAIAQRQLHIFGLDSGEFSEPIHDYLEALRYLLEGKVTLLEADQKRLRAREAVARVMSRYLRA